MYTSKQPFLKSKQPFSKSKQTFNKSKQPFRKSKQTFRKFKQPFRKSKQPFRRRPRIGPGDRIDYRNMSLINRFISEQGKILSRRINRLTLKQQRLITLAIKQARILSFLPFRNYENEKQFQAQSISIITGSPGTGKTTRLIKIVEKHLRLGVQPWEMVYVSFTNKAIDEAVDRVLKKFKSYKSEDFNNFRTIHSFCKKAFTNLPVLDPKVDMLQFHTQWGTISANFSEEDANHKVFNNWSLRVYDKARNMMINPIDLYKAEPMKKVRLQQFTDIIRNYIKFKKNHKMDFTDMVEKYVNEVNTR